MAAGAPVIAHGITWEVSDGASGTDSIGRIIGMTLPSAETEEKETTHMGSANKTREFIGGFIDMGEATVNVHFDPGSDEDLIINALHASSEEREHTVTLPTSAGGAFTWTFNGWIKRVEPGVEVGEVMTTGITFRATSYPAKAAV